MKIRTRQEAIALGLTRYYTGNLCPKSHLSERNVSSCSCVECDKEYSKSPRGLAFANNRQKKWYRTDKGQETIKKKHIRGYAKFRYEILLIVGKGKIECINCRCNDIRCIEINHINLGGGKEIHELGGSAQFHRSILDGSRSIKDLELRCRLCNALHYLEAKYGVLPFKIEWTGIME